MQTYAEMLKMTDNDSGHRTAPPEKASYSTCAETARRNRRGSRAVMSPEPTPFDRYQVSLPPGLELGPAAPPVSPSAPVLSVVVPLLNEEDVLEETYRRLLEFLGL